jgi:OOP family OmpA-OmpF porin
MKNISLLSFFALVLLSVAPVASHAAPLDGWYDKKSSFKEKPAGMAFHQNLYVEYRKLSKDRASDMGDGTDAELFNHKALLASTRSAVQHDSVDDRKLSEAQRKEFAGAVDRLHSLFERGGRELAAVETATAQVSFDCWIEATEAARKDAAASCKTKFMNALMAGEAKANRQLGQIQVVSPVPAPVVPEAPVAVKPPQEYYRVPFEFDSTKPTAEGEAILAKAIKDVKDIAQLKIALRAHADRSGSDMYNMQLSKRRVETVLNRMAAAGIAQERLRIVEAVGESRSLMKTADGVKAPENRVVEIDLRQ